MQAEAALRNEILLALTSGGGPYRLIGLTLFVNSTGALFDSTGRLVRYGLCKGGSDLIGLWGPAGIFVALEIKTKSGGRPTAEQEAFLEMVRRRGGIGAWATSPEEAYERLASQMEVLQNRSGHGTLKT